MKNIKNKIPNKLWIPAMLLSILSLIPMYFVFTYVMDMAKLSEFDTIGAVKVDEIMSRNIHELKFLLPCIAICLITVSQGILSAFIIKNHKGWQNKGFAITNLFFGGLLISNVFLLFKLIKQPKKSSIIKTSSIGVGTAATIAIPLSLFAVSMGAGSIDDPTHLSNIVMNSEQGKENVLEIFTDGFDPKKALPFFQKDPLFKDFISMDRMVTGGYTTEPSYTEMMGGITRNPYFLQRELDRKDSFEPVKGLSTDSWSAYLHENFMDSLLNRMRKDEFKNTYIGNPDDDGYFKTYFQHVSGDPEKLVKRNDFLNSEVGKDKETKLQVYNWGQAKDETATAGVSSYQNNVAVYKWMENNVKVTKTGHGSRIFLQDSITHAPRVIGKDGSLSFTAVADSATINENVAFVALHKVLHDLIASLQTSGVYDNTLISIYGDHSDHSNSVPDIDTKDPSYIKNWGEAIIKYPHIVNNKNEVMVSNLSPLYGPNMGDLISDYFDDKTRFDGKSTSDVSNTISADLKSHVANYNHFITLTSLQAHNGSFVTFENIDNDNAKLVPYTPTALDKARAKDLKRDPNDNWMNYKDFLKEPGLESEILGMGWA